MYVQYLICLFCENCTHYDYNEQVFAEFLSTAASQGKVGPSLDLFILASLIKLYNFKRRVRYIHIYL